MKKKLPLVVLLIRLTLCIDLPYFLQICSWKGTQGQVIGDEGSHLYHLLVSFFAHGYGGSHLRDWMMGVSPGLFASKTVASKMLVCLKEWPCHDTRAHPRGTEIRFLVQCCLLTLPR